MPSRSASQQRLFGMIHAYQRGKLRHAPEKVKELAERISPEDVEHFAKTKHDGLPERKKKMKKAAEFVFGLLKTAKPKTREKFVSDEGVVENYTPDKSKNHDEIVVRLRDGRVIRISNNTVLGKRLKATIGSKLRYHGYEVPRAGVVHKTHPNAHSRGGWLEQEKTAESQQIVVSDGIKTYVFPSIKSAALFISANDDTLDLADVQKMLYDRKPEISSFKITYPVSGSSDGSVALDLSTGSVPTTANPQPTDTSLKLTGAYSPSAYGGI